MVRESQSLQNPMNSRRANNIAEFIALSHARIRNRIVRESK